MENVNKELILSVNNINKIYKNFSLKNVSFNVYAGDIIGFVGENGAGKSTTLKAIINLINLNSGEVNIFNKKYTDLNQTETQDISFVPDEICLPTKLNLKQINSIFKSMFNKWNSETFFKYLQDFSLPIDLKIKKFSKGMKAKLNLAVAFSHDARFLILDEPMNGLDPVSRYEVMEILHNFMKVENRAIIVSSHIISDLDKLCNRILLIDDGVILINEEKNLVDRSFDVVDDISKEEFETLDKKNVVRYKVAFDRYSLLVKRNSGIPNARKAGLEDIIVYMIRGEKI